MKLRSKSIPIVLSSALMLGLALAGCQSSTAPTVPAAQQQKKDPHKDEVKLTAGGGESTAAPAQITEFKESPFFQGKGLPAVKDRLPSDYKITNEIPANQMKYEIGQYGGNLRTVTSAVDWDADVFVMSNEPLLNTPGILGDEITGNVLKDYKADEDQKKRSHSTCGKG